MFEDDFNIWKDFDLPLHRSILNEIPAEMLEDNECLSIRYENPSLATTWPEELN